MADYSQTADTIFREITKYRVDIDRSSFADVQAVLTTKRRVFWRGLLRFVKQTARMSIAARTYRL